MMMPPMKVTQRAAPQAVEKQRRWASFRKGDSLDELRPSDFDPNVSGENITPMAKKATAARNLVSQAISLLLWPHALRLTVVEAWHLTKKPVGSLYLFIYHRTHKSPPASIEVIYSNVGYLLYRRIILTYVQVTENAISTLGDLRSTCAWFIQNYKFNLPRQSGRLFTCPTGRSLVLHRFPTVASTRCERVGWVWYQVQNGVLVNNNWKWRIMFLTF